MIPETPLIPKRIEPQDRFVTELRKQLRIYAEEINKLEKRIKELEENNG